MIKKYLSNILGICIVIAYFLAGKWFAISMSDSIFTEVDILTGNIILVVVGITIGILVMQYWFVLIASSIVLVSMHLLPDLTAHFGVTSPFVIAVVLVILGFSSIANLSRQFRSNPA